jgi:hypothetical protein
LEKTNLPHPNYDIEYDRVSNLIMGISCKTK